MFTPEGPCGYYNLMFSDVTNYLFVETGTYPGVVLKTDEIFSHRRHAGIFGATINAGGSIIKEENIPDSIKDNYPTAAAILLTPKPSVYATVQIMLDDFKYTAQREVIFCSTQEITNE